MKTSQLKQMIKEAAKEAVVEVLNELSSQSTYIPQRLSESYVTPTLANNLRNMFTTSPQTQQQPIYQIPNQQAYVTPKPTIQKQVQSSTLGNIFGAVANRLDANDIAAMGSHDFDLSNEI